MPAKTDNVVLSLQFIFLSEHWSMSAFLHDKNNDGEINSSRNNNARLGKQESPPA